LNFSYNFCENVSCVDFGNMLIDRGQQKKRVRKVF
jgi:hypothetical protein